MSRPMHCLNTQIPPKNPRGQANTTQANEKKQNEVHEANLGLDNSNITHTNPDPLKIPINQLHFDSTLTHNGVFSVKIDKQSINRYYDTSFDHNKLKSDDETEKLFSEPQKSLNFDLHKRTALEMVDQSDHNYAPNDIITKNIVVEAEFQASKLIKLAVNNEKEEIKSSDQSDEDDPKHRNRITMSQNYKSTLTRGFLRVIKNVKNVLESDYHRFLYNYIEENKDVTPELAGQNTKSLACSIIEYIVDKIQGKGSKRKKSKTKVGNVKVIQSIFFSKKSDDEVKAFKKKAAHKLLMFFLKPENFEKWVETECNSNEGNKKFLLENLDEMRKVFEDPLNYKADFNSK